MTRKKGNRDKPDPPGGRVLQRLLLFNEARSVNEEEKIVPEEVLAAARPLARATKQREAAQTLSSEEIATVYMETAIALKSNGGDVYSRSMGAAPLPMSAELISRALVPPAWRFIGPTMIPNQPFADSFITVSGRVAAVAIDPSNSSHLLCGAAQGGVWESRDTGATWSSRTDFMPTLTVGALAFNPTAPATVYCGTGEGNFYNWLGAGVLRSTNGGATWSVVATNPFVGQGFFDLIVDPANGNHLLAATTGGIYESTDGGAVWTQRRNKKTWDLAMSPAGGATAEVLAGCVDGLFRSNDGGTTWTEVSLPDGPVNFDRLAVAIAPSNPAVAYAFGAVGRTPLLWRRTTTGGAFAAQVPPAGFLMINAYYNWCLEVSRDTDAQIYLGAIDVHRGTLSGTTWSWVTISNKPGDDIHADQHAIAIDPANPDVIYVGNDGGLFRSPNRGMNWTALNNGLCITEIEYIAHDLGSSRWVLAGTQDNGTIRYTGKLVWEHSAGGDGGDCGVNLSNPDTVFHTHFYMGMGRSTSRGNAGSFVWIGPNVPETYQKLFYPPMEANDNTVAQAGQSVFVSRNNGTNWTEVALPAGVVASAMSMPNPDNVYVGSKNGRLFRISWTGDGWSSATELTSPRPSTWISDIYVGPADANRIWVTITTMGGGRVFRSDNAGLNWINRSTGLPVLPINAVQVDPADPNRVWVAADLGVYQSVDGGNSWSPFSNGLPNALAADLLFHPHARVLRVATRNRGVWEIPVDGWLQNPLCATLWTETLAGNATQRWFATDIPATWHVILTVMPSSVRAGAPQLAWTVKVERTSTQFVTYWIEVTNLTPDPVTFEGRYAILSVY